MIAIIDYGRGNLFSIGQALHRLGETFEVVTDPEHVRRAERVILPGVGAFGDAMRTLRDSGMIEAVREVARSGRTLVGICLGAQMLAERSEEFGLHDGLGLIEGDVKALPSGSERIPNVGWRRLEAAAGNHAMASFVGRYFYFVHSFHVVCRHEQDVAATIRMNGAPVTAVLWRDNVRGAQFHPEKSGPAGLDILHHMLNR